MRKDRVLKVVRETVKIFNDRKYVTKDGKTVLLDVDYKSNVLVGNICANKEPKHETLDDIVFELNTNPTVLNIFKENRADKIGVLNFASAKRVCGGFLSGRTAQEESLARCSNLYPSLSRVYRDYYVPNIKNKSPEYLERLVTSENVTFFRNELGELVNRVRVVDVVTSPAPNRNRIRNKITETEINLIIENRIRNIINSFVLLGNDNIILGAWGCGVFGNDPVAVAKAFHKILITEKMALHFDKIIFSVYGEDTRNFIAFKDVFNM